MLHLLKHLSQLLRSASHPTTIALASSLHRRALLFSTSASPDNPTPFSIGEYLVSTCGLTSGQALKASKKLPLLKSASNPDAVLALLSGAGLSRPDIAAVVAADPLLLRSRVSNIAPRLASLRDRVGLSDPQICRFLLAGGSTGIRSCDIAPRLEFWIRFFGSFDKLLQIIRSNNRILKTDLEKVVKPNIVLLEQCGLSVCDIVKTCSKLLVYNPERVMEFVMRVDKLGVPRSSYAFKHAMRTVCFLSEDKMALRMEFLSSILDCPMEKIRVVVCTIPQILGLSEEKLHRKVEFLTSILGCSMDKISVAVCKNPCILGLTEERLRLKIEFMVAKVGLEPEYIVERPMLLNLSLEHRLVPRHHVAKMLEAKGLMKEAAGFYTLVKCSNTYFMAKYIDRHKDAVPELADAYAASCAGKMPAKVQL